MTTNVIINAHCDASKKEVYIMVTGEDSVVEEFTIQDGEKAERVVYDGRVIIVEEVDK